MFLLYVGLILVNSMLFHFFPDTVADNGWKNHMSSNFVFSELKNGGVESRGTPSRPKVEMGCTPA